MVGVRGRVTDVVNHGRLGPKGLYGSTQWASSPDRLTRPLVRVGGRLVETDWDSAMGRVVEVSKRLLAENGPLTHGFYTSGQLASKAASSCCGSRPPTRRSPCPSPPASAGSWPATSASPSSRTCSSPRPPQLADVVLPAAGWGEKTGMLHQRQPHRPPLREGRRTAR